MASTSNNPFSPGDRVVAYMRDSGHEDQELSIRQQEQSIRDWCTGHDLILTTIFKDEARPGSSASNRPAFQEMIEHFHSRDCIEKGLILWSLSRFARNISDSQFYKSDLRHMGYIVYSMTDNIPNGKEKYIFEAIHEIKNEDALESMSNDISRGLNFIVRDFGAVPGHPPPGFKREPFTIGKHRDGTPRNVSRWVIDEEKAPLIRAAWRMRADGSPFRQIDAALHLATSWPSYNYFFQNKLYIGTLVYAGVEYPGYVDPLIDLDTWNRVQEVNAKNRNRPRVRKGVPDPDHPRRLGGSFLLSGLVYCAFCNALLKGHVVQFGGKKRNDYYVCPNARASTSCSARSIPKEEIEQMVSDQISEYILDPVLMFDREQQKYDRAKERRDQRLAAINNLEKILTVEKRKITNLVNRIADEPSAPRSVLETIAQLENSVAVQEAEIDRLKAPDNNVRARTFAEVQELSAKMAEVMTSEDVVRKRTFVRLLVSRVVAGVHHDPDGDHLRGTVYLIDDSPPDDVKKKPPSVYGLTPTRDTHHRHKLHSLDFSIKIR